LREPVALPRGAAVPNRGFDIFCRTSRPASGLPLASGKIWIGSVGNIATPQTPSGDLTVSNAGVFTLGTVNANVGSFGSTTQCATVTVNAKGLITAASAATCTPAIGSVTGLGTGVATALGNTSWSTWSPTISCGSGTMTALGTVTARYRQLGKTVFFYISIPITTNGTCATLVQATLPLTAANTANQSAVGRYNGLTGKSLGARILSNTSNLRMAHRWMLPGGTRCRRSVVRCWQALERKYIAVRIPREQNV